MPIMASMRCVRTHGAGKVAINIRVSLSIPLIANKNVKKVETNMF